MKKILRAAAVIALAAGVAAIMYILYVTDKASFVTTLVLSVFSAVFVPLYNRFYLKHMLNRRIREEKANADIHREEDINTETGERQ